MSTGIFMVLLGLFVFFLLWLSGIIDPNYDSKEKRPK